MVKIKNTIEMLDAKDWNKKYFNQMVTRVIDIKEAYEFVINDRFERKKNLMLGTDDCTKFINDFCKEFSFREKSWLKYGYEFKFNSDDNKIIVMNKAYGILIFELENI